MDSAVFSSNTMLVDALLSSDYNIYLGDSVITRASIQKYDPNNVYPSTTTGETYNDVGGIIGGIVGGVVGLAIVIVVIVVLVKRSKSKKKPERVVQVTDKPYETRDRPVSRIIGKKDVTDKMRTEIQSIVNATCKTRYLGKGNEEDVKVKTEHYTSLTVVKVFRLENPILLKKYKLQMEALALQGEHLKLEVETDKFKLTSAVASLNKNLNECFLFHGTSYELVDTIITDGFEDRISKLEGMFGAGVYLAENSSKADQYSSNDDAGLFYMFITRACLGSAMETIVAHNGLRKPPEMPEFPGRFYDSVVGVPKTRNPNAMLNWYREFVVYERTQLLPEYLIAYRRT